MARVAFFVRPAPLFASGIVWFSIGHRNSFRRIWMPTLNNVNKYFIQSSPNNVEYQSHVYKWISWQIFGKCIYTLPIRLIPKQKFLMLFWFHRNFQTLSHHSDWTVQLPSHNPCQLYLKINLVVIFILNNHFKLATFSAVLRL